MTTDEPPFDCPTCGGAQIVARPDGDRLVTRPNGTLARGGPCPDCAESADA